MSRVFDYNPPGITLQRFMESNAKVRLLVGPYGSGKSSCAVNEIMRRAKMQRPSPKDRRRKFKVLVVRGTFTEIKMGTIPTWDQFFPIAYAADRSMDSPMKVTMKLDDLDFELHLMALQDDQAAKKVLSSEYTMVWIEEARNIGKGVFDAVFARTNRYPSIMDGGPTWSGAILTTNPFDTSHWLYKVAIENPPPIWETFIQPSALSPEAENIENLGPNYYQDLVHGKSEDWIRVNIMGQFGNFIEGKPVYENHYDDTFHVAKEPLKADPKVGLVIGADFGIVTNAAVIGQKFDDGRIVILDELITDNVGVRKFATVLSSYVANHYPDHAECVAGWCDPSGTVRSLIDEETPLQIMKQHTSFEWREAPTDNSINQRLEAVRYYLDNSPKGHPSLLISPKCKELRKALSNAYHFKLAKSGSGDVVHEIPEKNHPYSDLADALGYLAISLGGWDAVLNRKSLKPDKPVGNWSHFYPEHNKRRMPRQAVSTDPDMTADDPYAHRSSKVRRVRSSDPEF